MILRLCLGAVLAALLAACQSQRQPQPLPLPQVMIWAWERPEDLRFLDELPASSRPGVAYLDSMIFLRARVAVVQQRVSSLRLPPGVAGLPVLRIETDRAPMPAAVLDAEQRQRLLDAVVRRVESSGCGQVQLDFEATASQRDFYRRFLFELRERLGAAFRISITALTSWCLQDRWLAALPVDEIVPMFYRLGPDGAWLRHQLGSGQDLARECRRAHGFSIDEPLTRLPSPRRVYLFSPRSWQPVLLDQTMQRLGQTLENAR